MKEPVFYRRKLDNGITVLCEERMIPVVATATSVKFGAQFENKKIKGISHFMEHLVFKGTTKRDVVQISKEIEDRGGILNAFTSEELTCFWNKMPSKHFHLGADITRDLVSNPLFEEKALERERKVVLEEIKMYHDNPTSFIFEKIKELLYKKPFNISITGTAKTVSQLSRKTILDLHNKVYSSNNLIFSVVGNVDNEEVIKEAQKFVKKNYAIKPMKIQTSFGTFVHKRKGIDQAHEVLGFHMPSLSHKQRHAAELFDNILGGGMSSRLFQEIREKRGLGYAIKSHLEQSKDYAYEVIYVGTVKEKIQEVKKLILNEIRKLKELQQRDLSDAKERLIGLRALSKERCENTMFELLQEEIAGSAENYYKYEENISKVKLSEVCNLSTLKNYSFAALIPH
ncbi:insulinase family protein [Candidatus Pacearchaeota archaeon]|nr:insulinase family protein [Candidatus Pacearchaeota archaeon]